MNYTSIEIVGGLGNQLFQIAMILYFIKQSLDKGNKRNLFFKYEERLENTFNLPRKTFWNTLFKDQFNVLQPVDIQKLEGNFELYHELHHHRYQELPYNRNKNILFKGYFQSFKFIDDDIRQQMIKHIYSNQQLVQEAKDKYNEIKQTLSAEDDNMVSMHIRRTDYVYSSDYHHNLDLRYYKTALELAAKPNIVVFSDDIEWCRQNISRTLFPYNAIYFVDTNNVEQDFLLMSLFKHNIIANSTFSLWASFISPYEDKIIIAPSIWYGPSGSTEWQEIYHKYITHIIG
jgi:hypothetical protein